MSLTDVGCLFHGVVLLGRALELIDSHEVLACCHWLLISLLLSLGFGCRCARVSGCVVSLWPTLLLLGDLVVVNVIDDLVVTSHVRDDVLVKVGAVGDHIKPNFISSLLDWFLDFRQMLDLLDLLWWELVLRCV